MVHIFSQIRSNCDSAKFIRFICNSTKIMPIFFPTSTYNAFLRKQHLFHLFANHHSGIKFERGHYSACGISCSKAIRFLLLLLDYQSVKPSCHDSHVMQFARFLHIPRLPLRLTLYVYKCDAPLGAYRTCSAWVQPRRTSPCGDGCKQPRLLSYTSSYSIIKGVCVC